MMASRTRRRNAACFQLLGTLGVAFTSCVDATESTSAPIAGCDAACVDAGHHAPDPDDAEVPEPPVPDAAQPDATPAEPEPRTCERDEDCSDGTYCNGREHCTLDGDDAGAKGTCERGAPPCLREVACVEALQRCDCDFDGDGIISARCGGPDCDEDADRHKAEECGGDDCDDTDAQRFAHNPERCDADGHDEDCNPTTVAGKLKAEDPVTWDRLADKDQDGAIDVHCTNFDSKLAVLHYADRFDCDDSDPAVAVGAEEKCDSKDNDCDGYIDETDGAGQSFGLHRRFCFDADGDGEGVSGNSIHACARPAGYVPCASNGVEDCNDDEPNMRHGDKVTEVCDGLDNDCDGFIDQLDKDVDPLPDQLSFPQTKLVCTAHGKWAIDMCPDDWRWCHSNTVADGCETDATRLSTCRGCQTACLFSCGKLGCDEVRNLTSGASHSCAVTNEGRVACWGLGQSGQLGNFKMQTSFLPSLVQGLEAVKQVAAGAAHSCAIAGDDRVVYCWGSNASGQLASLDEVSVATTPGLVTGPDEVRGVLELAAGNEHTCAVLETGQVICWGQTKGGRLGDLTTVEGVREPKFVLRPEILMESGGTAYHPLSNATSVATGEQHSCLLTTEGTVECWGSNNAGQLGADRSVSESAFARPVPGLSGVTRIAAGAAHSCALTPAGVYCWGSNVFLQLGRQSDDRDYEPRLVVGLPAVAALSLGQTYSCVRTQLGLVMCWGDNGSGQIGLPDVDMQAEPNTIGVPAVTELSAGADHVCALGTDGKVLCWGDNNAGQLGTGSVSLDRQLEPLSLAAVADSKP